jgi:amino acid transporter
MSDETSPQLERGLNTLHATSLNVSNMLGAGPFITIPLLLGSMGGPQAMLGWLVAMLVVMCDGLIWAELGAAYPGTGGTYHYLREIFRGSAWGRFLPFLFIWQFLVSGTLEVASGYVAASGFILTRIPGYDQFLENSRSEVERVASGISVGLAEKIVELNLVENVVVGVPASLMVGMIYLALRQRVRSLGWLSTFLVAGVLAAVGTVIVLGATNFDASLITFPENAFQLNDSFLFGLGAAMSVAVYDYLGYYNICHLGEEVRAPEKTIPRAVLLSIVIVAAIYMAMNLAFIGVVPWQETLTEGSLANKNIAAAFMTKLFNERAADAFTALIVWTCLAGLFAMTLGYSRILYAAAKNGDFFRPFAALHPTRGYPWAALALLSGLTAFFCFFPLLIVIQGAVTIRIVVQFIAQVFAVHALRTAADRPQPFRMWFYPLPSLIALAGWLFLLSTNERKLIILMFVVYGSGLAVYILRDHFAARKPSVP